MFRYVPYIPTSSNTFIIQGFWIVSKGISASNEVSIGYFLSVCLNDRLLIWFSYVESSLHHWEEAYLIMVDDLLIFPWILFVFYCILFHVHRKKNWSVIHFFMWIIVLLAYLGDCGLIKWICQCLFCFYFGELF